MSTDTVYRAFLVFLALAFYAVFNVLAMGTYQWFNDLIHEPLVSLAIVAVLYVAFLTTYCRQLGIHPLSILFRLTVYGLFCFAFFSVFHPTKFWLGYVFWISFLAAEIIYHLRQINLDNVFDELTE